MRKSSAQSPEKDKPVAAWRYKKWPRVLLFATAVSVGALTGGVIGHSGSVSQERAVNRELDAQADTLQRCRDYLAKLVTGDKKQLVIRSTSLPQSVQADCGVQNALQNREADYQELQEIGWQLPDGASVASATETVKIRMPSVEKLDGQIGDLRADAADFYSRDVAVRTIAAGAIGAMAGGFAGALGVVSILPPVPAKRPEEDAA